MYPETGKKNTSENDFLLPMSSNMPTEVDKTTNVDIRVSWKNWLARENHFY